jgi:transcriptional regulator with XRE-family HTH domain
MASQVTDDFAWIVQSLGKFQLIECTLKVSLVRHEIEEDKQEGKLKELYSISELIDIPYGVLLKRYKKINPNSQLNDRLLILKNYRNHLAHQAFISALDWPPNIRQLVGLNHTTIDYAELNKELDECAALITQEFNFTFKK